MKHVKPLLIALVFCLTLITGCEKGTLTDSSVTPNASKGQSARLSAGLKEKLAKLRSSLPAGYEKRLQHNAALLLKTHPEYREMVSLTEKRSQIGG